VLRLPGPRHGGEPAAADRRQRHLHRDRAGPRRPGAHGPHRCGAAPRRGHRAALGHRYDTVVRSFVNVIATPKGGTHVSGFERALVRVINDQLRATKLLKANDEPVTKEDVLEGLTAVVTVRLPEPQFEGQTKEVLGTSAASRIVS